MTGSGHRHRLGGGNLYGPLISRTSAHDFQSHSLRPVESITGPAEAYYKKKRRRIKKHKKLTRKSLVKKRYGAKLRNKK